MDAAMKQLDVQAFFASKFPIAVYTPKDRIDLTIEEAQLLLSELQHSLLEARSYQMLKEMNNEKRTG